ncbi:hypothetical protein [Sediminibacillus albus]|uniref:Uncharacterized protein n=1 Tax=Sediminibacillus albus TaxID=407036 RepID=A0A1G9CC65_9BACI|nr:hypothetical protein [Sediminibacillus albus]SDK49272.1 hypothetical protein SAMN05216243_3369 [Sediminibacillus albus]
MSQKPLHYDGSGPITKNSSPTDSKPFIITDEARKNISGNPYTLK